MNNTILDRKIDYWEHQLLDLGKRNKMINYRETKRATLKITEPSIGDLFQRLAVKEEKLTFQRAIDKETDIRVFSILSLLESLHVSLPVTVGDIGTESSILERQKTLKHLRSKSRLALEEQGTNILYLSFGFIEWKEGKGASAKWIKSPLVLVPVVLSLDSLNSPYTLEKHEDDIVVNPTLDYYLNTEYGIDLPEFDEDKESIDDFLIRMEEIADMRGWRIIPEVSLGLLSFLKISMYNDLRSNEERIKKNPVIRAMAGDTEEVNQLPEELHGFDLDSIGVQDCYQVMSADSSQQDAILYSKNNVSFVMQGPPGTGKSQTITNIIAEALADGKKVLFVSEKMAALQVVYRRLQEAHLGEFCLPLHSYKANKKEILEQIGANLRLKQTRVKDTAKNSLNSLQSIRDEINAYAKELHQVIEPLNMSCYEVYGKLDEVRESPLLSFTLNDVSSISQSDLNNLLGLLKRYSLAVSGLNYYIKDNPWDGIKIRTIGYDDKERFAQCLSDTTDLLERCINELSSIEESDGVVTILTYNQVADYCNNLFLVSSMPEIPSVWQGQENIDAISEQSVVAEARYNKLKTLRKKLHIVFNDTAFSFDYNGWADTISDVFTQIQDLGFLNQNNHSNVYGNAESTAAQVQALSGEITAFEDSISGIETLLGTKLSRGINSVNLAAELVGVIKGNQPLMKDWLLGDVDRVKQTVFAARALASEIKAIEQSFLQSWEKEILTFDYLPVLQRFKTDYTSIFKAFNQQYRADKKSIQALSINVIKKLTDDAALDILNQLKIYHEKLDLFHNNSAAYAQVLGYHFTGIDTDWDLIIQLADICLAVQKVFKGRVPEKTVFELSRDHQAFNAPLSSYTDNATDALTKARDIIEKNQFKVDCKTSDIHTQKIVTTAGTLVSLLNQISAKKTEMRSCLNNVNTDYFTIKQAIDGINEYNQVELVINDSEKEYAEVFDFLFQGEKTDWKEIYFRIEQYQQIRSLQYYSFVQPLINSPDSRRNEIMETAGAISSCLRELNDSIEWLDSNFIESKSLKELNILLLLHKLNACKDTLHLIEKWIDYQEAKSDCIQNGLDSYITKIELEGTFDEIGSSFLKGFYQMWLSEAYSDLPAVRRFRRNVQDDRVAEFAKLDDYQLKVAQMRIREKLIENLPTTSRLLKGTDEISILNKELGKKRRIMPLRKLFRQIPNLLLKLKPCLMMSPLSVSYFLETEAYNFDMVIFDEASQIFPEDAIGAIFRGAQVIIAGDSKQLPPTNFFAATTNNFDSDYDIDDEDVDFAESISDSILEETASALPNRTLLWHYRSKHESLISFSNSEIYKKTLITFPNSSDAIPDMGVEYIYVPDGYYEGGGKNCNIAEAQKCVELVADHIRNHPERSLGIIAFSEKQQTAIENAIIEFREENPLYEYFFDEAIEEPFFVKNLENVQGDERDTIIFSICYAKDRNGRMYMRFGPLGHEGGERRLNVAITRAKCNVKLVGSILPSDIDLNRTKSEGVRMLRSYIEFARSNSSSGNSQERVDEFTATDEFCDEVAAFLIEKGYQIQRRIGCSDYRIDIAVENPDVKDDFIAGIECDGLSYIQAKTARDRDHLRRKVLESMGWNMYRVWSTEWSKYPDQEKQALVDFLESLVNGKGQPKHDLKTSNTDDNDISIEEIAVEQKRKEKAPSANPYGFAYYKEAKWWETEYTNRFDNDTRIADAILHIVREEQPIHLEMLYKRLGGMFTAGRATSAVKYTIDLMIERKLKGRVQVEDQFVRTLPLEPITVRIPKRYDTPRPMEYIHNEEVALAMVEIVRNSYGLSPKDLATECARAFGFERQGQKIKAKTQAAFSLLIDKGLAKIVDGKVYLTGGN